MAMRVVEFSSSGTKLERFLSKNQHAQFSLGMLILSNFVSPV
jgi:hypothetical protein